MNAEYDALPECIRQYYTEQEYMWLSDAQKSEIMQHETDPDAES